MQLPILGEVKADMTSRNPRIKLLYVMPVNFPLINVNFNSHRYSRNVLKPKSSRNF